MRTMRKKNTTIMCLYVECRGDDHQPNHLEAVLNAAGYAFLNATNTDFYTAPGALRFRSLAAIEASVEGK
jgi:hypothetical protein